MVKYSTSSYKINYVIVIKNSLNPEGHQNPISGLKVMAILLKGWILPIGGASAGEGLRLQPAQQACFKARRPYEEGILFKVQLLHSQMKLVIRD